MSAARISDLSVESDEIPDEIYDHIHGYALFAGAANVIMQLSRLPVGRGVAESRVESGRVDLHPVKRLRTTTAFLVIASLGTREERLALRKQINRAHAQVRSRPGDDVEYNAFDPELQLWVAACLYKGVEDLVRVGTGGEIDAETMDVLYHHGRRFGTTLQVDPAMWPADREAFEEYWQSGLAQIEMDEVTRPYLQGIAEVSFSPFGPGWLRRLNARLMRGPASFMTLGFLDPAFIKELGLEWTDEQQRRHDRLFGLIGRLSYAAPRPIQMFPLNLYLWDTRRRLRKGLPVI